MLKPGEDGSVRAPERSARPQPARHQGPPRRAGSRTVGRHHRAGAVPPRRSRRRRAPDEGDRLGQVRDPAAQRSGGPRVLDHPIARRAVRPDRVGGPADVHEAAGPDRQHALRVRRRRRRRCARTNTQSPSTPSCWTPSGASARGGRHDLPRHRVLRAPPVARHRRDRAARRSAATPRSGRWRATRSRISSDPQHRASSPNGWGTRRPRSRVR